MKQYNQFNFIYKGSKHERIKLSSKQRQLF